MNEREDIKHNPFMIMIIGLLATIVIGGFVFGAYWLSKEEFRLPAYLDELEKELNSIPEPTGTKAITVVRRSDRRVRMAVYRDYRSTLSARDLERFYDERVASQGWCLGRKATNLGGHRILQYCKNDIRMTVQVLDEIPSLVYGVAIVWPSGRECE